MTAGTISHHHAGASPGCSYAFQHGSAQRPDSGCLASASLLLAAAVLFCCCWVLFAAAVLFYSPVGEYSKGGYPFPKSCHKCPQDTTTPGRGSYSPDQCGKQQQRQL